MSDERVTLGEVYRLCQRIEAHSQSIEAKVDKTNGRVTALEKDNVRLKAYWTSGVIVAGFVGDYLKHKVFGA